MEVKEAVRVVKQHIRELYESEVIGNVVLDEDTHTGSQHP